MFVVDTNVLVYAADSSSAEHAVCRAHLDRWRTQPGAWYLTWGIVYEFLRVVTHSRVFPKPWTAREAWAFLEALLEAPGLDMLEETDRHVAVARSVLEEVPQVSGNLVFDARTAILMREHGIRRVYTRDTDFHRFPFIEVVDPLVE